MGDAAAWSPGVARRPPKKGGTGDLRVRLKEDKWNGRLSLEGLPRYDAMRDPNCPRASHNHKTSVFSNTTLLEEDFAGPRPALRTFARARLALRARSIGGAALLAGFEVGCVQN